MAVLASRSCLSFFSSLVVTILISCPFWVKDLVKKTVLHPFQVTCSVLYRTKFSSASPEIFQYLSASSKPIRVKVENITR
ncbi:hypothetical protein V1521DRAFT_146238 [Lipomyces starkeyi]